MRIGIVVFSHTGNTLKAANELRKELERNGHTAVIDKVETAGDPTKKVEITRRPRTEGYEGVVFGSPVWGFRLSPVMAEYMKGMGSLNGKPAAVFVTKELTPKWMGGTGAVKTMKKLIEAKGGRGVGSGIIVWKKKTGPSGDLKDVITSLTRVF